MSIKEEFCTNGWMADVDDFSLNKVAFKTN